MFSIEKYRLILVLIAMLIGQGLSAQKTIISGTVRDAESKEVLPFVNLVFKGAKVGTTTDYNGRYRLETYYATDSLTASYLGYAPLTKGVTKDQTQVINFELSVSSLMLKEAEVVATEEENPAHVILRKIIANKKINNREKLQAYEYELYNKIEFDLNNLSEKFTEKKILNAFDFVFDNIDTTGEKSFLPIFMTESLSNIYYRQDPKTEIEHIQATKISGIDNNSVSQFLGDMYQSVNIYNNNVIVFGKSFVSPISSMGLTFYKYYLEDSTFIDNKWCYQIKFMPRRKQELTFTGDFWVNDTTFAIKEIEATIADDANINFVSGLMVRQEFDEVEKEVWMITQEQLLVDFNLNIRKTNMGLYGRKTTTYRNFVINQPRDESFYKGITDVVVAEDANKKEDAYWESARHVSLSKTESQVYSMVDSIQKVPQFRTVLDIVNLFFSGYKKVGNFEFGPYYTLYSYNPVEGHRIRLGGRTSNDFSTRLELSGYTAYGTNDQRFKYGGGFRYMLSKQPRMVVGLNLKQDIEQLGKADGAFQEDNVLSSIFRRNPATKLTDVVQTRAYLEREWTYGLANQLIFNHRTLRPLGSLEYKHITDEQELVDVHRIITSETTIYTRFAYKEKFVAGEFERISLGTKHPTIESAFVMGIPGIWGSEYSYEKLILRISDKIRLGPLGYVAMRLEGGKIWGTLPYPLLQIHQGNETFFYDETAFNTMNYFEFISDQWASIFATYHLEGLFLNKIPLFRKLNWREVLNVKAVVGGFDKKHLSELVLPEESYLLNKPFVEAAVGIENIFKFIRVDMLYRLSYLDHPDIQKWGIRLKLQIDF